MPDPALPDNFELSLRLWGTPDGDAQHGLRHDPAHENEQIEEPDDRHRAQRMDYIDHSSVHTVQGPFVTFSMISASFVSFESLTNPLIPM
ncbi:hypothetical protein [Komagataeibacter swingsii]|uniref:Uncharacterized protein n=1 Tax=Komagataeibacter swingsii TaxID=215220 RepID=A0A850NZP1_9PROT|nr:hypothetical protein [Komagataeibacter swingsii]NVN37158.1 hypothetical protein [Komagataeibacter swingsii]